MLTPVTSNATVSKDEAMVEFLQSCTRANNAGAIQANAVASRANAVASRANAVAIQAIATVDALALLCSEDDGMKEDGGENDGLVGSPLDFSDSSSDEESASSPCRAGGKKLFHSCFDLYSFRPQLNTPSHYFVPPQSPL